MRLRAASPLRRLGHELFGADVDDRWLDAVATAAETLLSRTAGVPRRRKLQLTASGFVRGGPLLAEASATVVVSVERKLASWDARGGS